MAVYKAFRIRSDDKGYRAGIEELPVPVPGAGRVLIRVAYSGVNYKDALAGTGRGKILATFPLVGGIDAAGVVDTSADGRFTPGDPVLVTGYGLSFDHDGGYAQYLEVSGDWVVPMPPGLDLRNAMILGTAGLTAALAIHRMQVNDQRPDLGPVLVTGATGGAARSLSISSGTWATSRWPYPVSRNCTAGCGSWARRGSSDAMSCRAGSGPWSRPCGVVP